MGDYYAFRKEKGGLVGRSQYKIQGRTRMEIEMIKKYGVCDAYADLNRVKIGDFYAF